MSVDHIIAILAIALAVGFDFVNGFHDTANAVATVIYTKCLKPGVAIVMSGILNFLGALLVGTAVAQVITKIIPPRCCFLADCCSCAACRVDLEFNYLVVWNTS